MTQAIAEHSEIVRHRTESNTRPFRESRPCSDLQPHEVSRDASAAFPVAHVLLIDSNAALVEPALRSAIPVPIWQLQVAVNGEAGLEQIRLSPPDVIILAWELPDRSGPEVFQEIRRIDSRIPTIVLTGVNHADTAIDAIKRGAFECLMKPLDARQVLCAIEKAIDVSQQTCLFEERDSSAGDAEPDGALIGRCSGMREVYKAIGQVAERDVTVLITGESGTGKELVARAIYRHSRRASGPFLALNCAAIPEHLLESELLGHEKGAFTGADCRRIGKFEQCNGGTIFLDEIGDMPLSLQAKVLRLLQEQSFQRVGGNETIRTDVRLIAATHHDLQRDSAERTFRADLYYRLGGFTIHLPPLRDRGDDLRILVMHFLRRFSCELGREVREIAPESLERLRRCPWPGNIRELQGILKRALLQTHGGVLLPEFLPALAGDTVEATPMVPIALDESQVEMLVAEHFASGQGDLYAEAHRQLDRILLARTLDNTGGNQHRAARQLGIGRETLRRRLRELGLHLTRHLMVAEAT